MTLDMDTPWNACGPHTQAATWNCCHHLNILFVVFHHILYWMRACKVTTFLQAQNSFVLL